MPLENDGTLCGVGRELDLESKDVLAGAMKEDEPPMAQPDAKHNDKINLLVVGMVNWPNGSSFTGVTS